MYIVTVQHMVRNERHYKVLVDTQYNLTQLVNLLVSSKKRFKVMRVSDDKYLTSDYMPYNTDAKEYWCDKKFPFLKGK